MKTGTRQAVLGIRISEFQVLSGTAIDYIQKVNISAHNLTFLDILSIDNSQYWGTAKAEYSEVSS